MAPSAFLLRSWPWRSRAPLSGNLLFLSLSSHIISLPLPLTIFLSLTSSLLFLSLKQLKAQNQTTTVAALMVTHASGGEPEDARMVAASLFRRETSSS